MFPLNPSTLFQFVLIGVALSSALALQFGWRWRLPLLAPAVALPIGWLRYDPPTGEYAGLGYLFAVVPSTVLLLLGAILGGGMRFARVAPKSSVAILFVLGGTVCGAALWYQYVPSACLKAPLEVQIGGETLHLSAELRPRLEIGNSVYWFGNDDRKSSSAQICRMSRNGTQAIKMDTVWITPAGNHQEMTAVCKGHQPPVWCGSYSSEPYRHIDKVLVALDTDHAFPLPYWQDGGSLKKDRQGDLIQGSVCLLPDAYSKTQCWIWEPFGDGFRLTISTHNLDPRFDDMPVEEAREMIRQVRQMILTIVKQ